MDFQISRVNNDLKPISFELRVKANLVSVDLNAFFPEAQIGIRHSAIFTESVAALK